MHEGSDSGFILIPLAVIFGYVVGNIGEHVLEKIGSILMAIGNEAANGGYVVG
jgi:hypothetical protein